MRTEIAKFLEEQLDVRVADIPLRTWVLNTGAASIPAYLASLRGTAWGSGLEITVASLLLNVRIDVLEIRQRRGLLNRDTSSYDRISSFGPDTALSTVELLYVSGIHYDAIVPCSSSALSAEVTDPA